MMNHPFVAACAKSVLKRADGDKEKDLEKWVERVYRAVFGRTATKEEIGLAREFLVTGDEPARARFVHALLQTSEFVFVD